MKKQNSILTTLPVLFGFFVMGFCDIVGISSDYVWGIERSGFFNGREKWVKGFESQMI